MVCIWNRFQRQRSAISAERVVSSINRKYENKTAFCEGHFL